MHKGGGARGAAGSGPARSRDYSGNRAARSWGPEMWESADSEKGHDSHRCGRARRCAAPFGTPAEAA
jgi:hypothetical protein